MKKFTHVSSVFNYFFIIIVAICGFVNLANDTESIIYLTVFGFFGLLPALILTKVANDRYYVDCKIIVSRSITTLVPSFLYLAAGIVGICEGYGEAKGIVLTVMSSQLIAISVISIITVIFYAAIKSNEMRSEKALTINQICSAVDSLFKMKEMQKDGTISDTEFEKIKNKLLQKF